MYSSRGTCLVILLTFFGSLCQQAPAYSRQFEVGTLYSFNYVSSVTLNEPQKGVESSPKDVGFEIDYEVAVSPVWQHPTNVDGQIFELLVSLPKLSVKSRTAPSPSSFVSKPSRADNLKEFRFFFHRDGGRIRKVIRSDKETLSAVNLKKGIISLFQYETKAKIVSETDASGRCDATYTQLKRGHFTKKKENCSTTSTAPFFNHTNKVLGAALDSQIERSYTLFDEDSTLKSAQSWETHILSARIRPEKGVEVISQQRMNRTGSTKSTLKTYKGKSVNEVMKQISLDLKESFLVENLTPNILPKECIQCKKLEELVNSFRAALTARNLATQSSCIAFLKLVRKMREVTKDEIIEVLTDRRNAKVINQLIDIVAAAQTVQSHQAVRAAVKFSDPIELPERYLQALSLNTHPLESVIEDLTTMMKKGIKDPKLYESLVLSLSAMTNTFMKNPRNVNRDVGSKVLQHLISQLKTTKQQSMKLTMLRAMQNLAMKDSVPTLLKYSIIGGSDETKVAIQAMRALQLMPEEYLSDQVFTELFRVLFQLNNYQDSSVRAMALNILLRNPKQSLLQDVLKMIQTSSDKEMNSLFLAMIKEASYNDEDLRKRVAALLSECKLDNYHSLSNGGMSSAISRSLTDPASTLNASFSNQLEMSGGLLKRSAVDVFLQNDADSLKLLSFDIFAGGLSSFAGDGDSVDDDQEANAGIEISLMSSSLRPIVLFSGSGQLMGYVMSGTGSERTPALQGSILLQDHLENVLLQNGLTIEISLTGVASIDFAGQIQISLWNSNAHGLVEIGVASVVQGQARVDNSFVQAMVEFNFGSQSQLDFVTDLDFYSDKVMCVQMVQQDFDLIDNVRKLESIPGSNYALRKYKRKVYPVPGKTYVMNKKNTEFCNKMFN